MMPATSNPPMEVAVIMPNITRGRLGGMMGPRVEDAKSCSIRSGSSGHTCENDAGNNVDMAKTTPGPAHKRFGKGENFLRNGTGVHDLAAIKEERNGNQ